MKDFLMVIMASGIARGRARTTAATTTTTTTTESRNMAATNGTRKRGFIFRGLSVAQRGYTACYVNLRSLG